MVAILNDERKALMAGLAGFAREPVELWPQTQTQMRREPPKAQPCVKIADTVSIVTGVNKDGETQIYGAFLAYAKAYERLASLARHELCTELHVTTISLNTWLACPLGEFI